MWSPKMTNSEVEKAWADILWATQFVNGWRLKCLLWFAIGTMTGFIVGKLT